MKRQAGRVSRKPCFALVAQPSIASLGHPFPSSWERSNAETDTTTTPQHRNYHMSPRTQVLEIQEWLGKGSMSKLLDEDSDVKPRGRLTEKTLFPWDATEAPDQNNKHYKYYLKELAYRSTQEEDLKRQQLVFRMGIEMAEDLERSLLQPLEENPLHFFNHYEEGAWDWSEEIPFPPPTVEEWLKQDEPITPMQIVWLLDRYKKLTNDDEKEREKIVAYVELLLQSLTRAENNQSKEAKQKDDKTELDLEEDYNMNFPECMTEMDYPLPSIGEGAAPIQSRVWGMLIDRLISSGVCKMDTLFNLLDATEGIGVTPLPSTWSAVFRLCQERDLYEEALRCHERLKRMEKEGGKRANHALTYKYNAMVLNICLNTGQTSRALKFYFDVKRTGFTWDSSIYPKMVTALGSPDISLSALIEFIEDYSKSHPASSDSVLRNLMLSLMDKSFLSAQELRIKNSTQYPIPNLQDDDLLLLGLNALPTLPKPTSATFDQQQHQQAQQTQQQLQQQQQQQQQQNEVDATLLRALELFQHAVHTNKATAPSYGIALRAYALLGQYGKCVACWDMMVRRRLPRTNEQISVLLDAISVQCDTKKAFDVSLRESLDRTQLGVAVRVMLKSARFDLVEQILDRYEQAGKPTPAQIYQKIIAASETLGDEGTATRFSKRLELKKQQQMIVIHIDDSPVVTAAATHHTHNNNNRNYNNQRLNGSKGETVRKHKESPYYRQPTPLTPQNVKANEVDGTLEKLVSHWQ